MRDTSADQQDVCRRFGTDFVSAPPEAMLGVAAAIGSDLRPLNGLRHPAEGHTCGWYIWAGSEFSEAADFFEPLHVVHLIDRCPEVIPYLGLGPGWRFLIDNGHEDVWYDPSLLQV